MPHLQNTNYTSANVELQNWARGEKNENLIWYSDSTVRKNNIWPGTETGFWVMVVVQKLGNKEVLLRIVHGVDMC